MLGTITACTPTLDAPFDRSQPRWLRNAITVQFLVYPRRVTSNTLVTEQFPMRPLRDDFRFALDNDSRCALDGFRYEQERVEVDPIVQVRA